MCICRVMLMAHRDAVNHQITDCIRGVDYGKYDLICSIDFAQGRLGDGLSHFPHDTDIDCRLFIRWANNQKKLISSTIRRGRDHETNIH